MEVLYAVLIIGGLGIVAGVILAFASKFFAVKSDERYESIRACLPSVNCGACGYAGCDGYAAAINEGSAQPNLCTPGGKETAEKLSEILGVKIETQKKIAAVKCNRSCSAATDFAYTGVASCAAASLFYGGPLGCKSGCIGFGDCVKACDSAAIELADGKAVVIEDKCIGCEKCAKACPKNIIEMIPPTDKPAVLCSSHEKGAQVRKVCEAGCIGCKKCEKVCPFDAIAVKDNLAEIDIEKCTACGECVRNCPTGCIK